MTIATRASRSAASATESTGSDPFRLPYVYRPGDNCFGWLVLNGLIRWLSFSGPAGLFGLGFGLQSQVFRVAQLRDLINHFPGNGKALPRTLALYDGECWTALYDDFALLAVLVHGRSRDKDGLGFVLKKKTHAKISPMTILLAFPVASKIVRFGRRVREIRRRGQSFGKRKLSLLSVSIS